MKLLLKIALSFIVFAIAFSSCMSFRRSERSLLKDMTTDGLTYDINYHTYQSKKVRYLLYKNQDNTKPLLVLIHGAPGSATELLFYIKNKALREKYSILIMDRLGYGYSDYGHYSPMVDQSKMIIDLILDHVSNGQSVYIAGHSFGASIAGLIASMKPSFLKATVMMAPALDPEIEKYFWFGKLGIWDATRWMATGALKVAADEKYGHAEELRSLKNTWSNVATPILHIHGMEDGVVPYANVFFSKSNIDGKYLKMYEWPGMNHFFPFTEENKVVEILSNYFEAIQ